LGTVLDRAQPDRGKVEHLTSLIADHRRIVQVAAT